VATTNPGKVREIQTALGDLPVRWLSLADSLSGPAPEETGATFAENALIKARTYAEATGRPTLAEDSGLMIDALGGRPGVASARYPGRTYADKFRRVYGELAPHPEPWTGRFVSAVAFAIPGEEAPAFSAEGVAEGTIASAPRGANGFGYDPIFVYAPTGKTGGELTDAEKLAVSHRGKALDRFRRWLLADG
jgi:XTP/dITP diphosphohydrolase